MNSSTSNNSRRGFVGRLGLGGIALQTLLAGDARGQAKHHRARAKNVIFLFMCGGVSHIDTFDPKDRRWEGKLIDAIGFGDNLELGSFANDLETVEVFNRVERFIAAVIAPSRKGAKVMDACKGLGGGAHEFDVKMAP